MQLLTASRVKSYRRCPRLHHLRYDLGIRPVESAAPLRFGTLVHEALAAWWDGPRDSALERAQALLASAHEVDPYDLVRAQVLLAGYDARWRDSPLVAECVEREFKIPFTNPESGRDSRTYELAGKVDAIVRDTATGEVWVLEHKTTSADMSPGSPYWLALRLDTQVSVYLRGAVALGYDVRGCIYDVLGKPALRPGLATPPESRKYTKDGKLYANQREVDETPDEFAGRLANAVMTEPDRYYLRGSVLRLEDEASEAAWELWQLARAMREGELAMRHPRNPDACFQWGRPCEYFGVCTGTESIEDPTRFARVAPHEELTQEAAS